MPFRRPQLLSDSQYHDCFSEASSEGPAEPQQAASSSRPSGGESRILPGYEMGISMQSGENSRVSRVGRGDGSSPAKAQGISQLKCIGSQDESSVLLNDDVSPKAPQPNGGASSASGAEVTGLPPISPNVQADSSQLAEGPFPSYVYTPADLSVSTPLLMGQTVEHSHVLGPSFSLNRTSGSLPAGYRRSAGLSQLDSILGEGPAAAAAVSQEVFEPSQVCHHEPSQSVLIADPEPENGHDVVDLTGGSTPRVAVGPRVTKSEPLVKDEEPDVSDGQAAAGRLPASSQPLPEVPDDRSFESSLEIARRLGLLEDSAAVVDDAGAYPSLAPPEGSELLPDEMETTAVQPAETRGDESTPRGSDEGESETTSEGLADGSEGLSPRTESGVDEGSEECSESAYDDGSDGLQSDSEPGEEPTPERSSSFEPTAMQDEDEETASMLPREDSEEESEEYATHSEESEGESALDTSAVLEEGPSESSSDDSCISEATAGVEGPLGGPQTGPSGEAGSTPGRGPGGDGHSMDFDESCLSARRVTDPATEFRTPLSEAGVDADMTMVSLDGSFLVERGEDGGSRRKSRRKRRRSETRRSLAGKRCRREEASELRKVPERFSPRLMLKVFSFLKLKPPLTEMGLETHQDFHDEGGASPHQNCVAGRLGHGVAKDRPPRVLKPLKSRKGAADPYAAARRRLQE